MVEVGKVRGEGERQQRQVWEGGAAGALVHVLVMMLVLLVSVVLVLLVVEVLLQLLLRTVVRIGAPEGDSGQAALVVLLLVVIIVRAVVVVVRLLGTVEVAAGAVAAPRGRGRAESFETKQGQRNAFVKGSAIVNANLKVVVGGGGVDDSGSGVQDEDGLS